METDRTLFLGVLGAKAEWYDPATGLGWRDEAAFTLLSRLEKDMLRGFKKGLRVRNIKFGGESFARGLRFSEGAEAWFKQGGLLRQEGVENIEFLID